MACDLKASDLMTIHSEWHSSFDLLDLCELCMRRTAYSAYHVSLQVFPNTLIDTQLDYQPVQVP